MEIREICLSIHCHLQNQYSRVGLNVFLFLDVSVESEIMQRCQIQSERIEHQENVIEEQQKTIQALKQKLENIEVILILGMFAVLRLNLHLSFRKCLLWNL